MVGLEAAHWVKPAGKTSTPPAVIFLDSETRTTGEGDTEVEVLRCWDAQFVRRRDRRRPGEVAWESGEDAGHAAAVVDAWASSGETTWLYAHNVTFDLVVTDLAAQLAARGWELSSRFGMSPGGMWCVLHKGRRESVRSDRRGRDGQPEVRVKWNHTLTIADSASLFPAPLADLAQHTGITKPPLPGEGDSLATWHARCSADVRILSGLVLALMDWWDTSDMGRWSVSGAGLGWQTYRRTLTPRQLVIDHDPAVIAWERQAVYGGRRDVFCTGQLPPGRYGEIDYEGAYPTIAASCPLPAKIAGPVLEQHRRLALKGKVPAGMLAEVTISTSTPRWPVRAGGRVFYPVGRFRTVLAAPDIQAAADAGALEAVHDGYMYCMTGHLRPWARWVLGLVRGAQDVIPGPVKVAAKLWSRAVIGKFAQRGWTTSRWVGEPCESWSVTETTDLYSGMRGVITGLAGEYYISWADQRGEHERPAVLAFVESHVRARLGGLIAGPFGPAIVQCDTDGIMVSHTALERIAAVLGSEWRQGRPVPWGIPEAIRALSDASWPLVMRQKTVFSRAVIYGPQHVVLDGKQRFAGVPKGAWQTGEGKWAARLWPGMIWQAQHGPPGGYARPVQPYLVIGPYAAGWVLADGTVRPAEVTAGESGRCELTHWKATRWAAAGDQLGPRQASWADGLWEAPPDDTDGERTTSGGPEHGAAAAAGMAAAQESLP